MFQRFSNVKSFSYSEVLLCFSIMLLEFSLAEMYARGFDVFPDMVKSGTFDRVLVRPRNEIIQVLGSKFELTRIGRMLQITTFIVPYALVQYYPLLYLLGRKTSPIYIFLPLAAILFLIPSYILWRIGVRHYKSSGS